jgi:S-adenosylmethionine:tRNA ribosyltransferase-isomerase
MMMTNFHMPRTTLLLMVESFVGVKWREIYSAAIEKRYRLLSFGDAMLLYRGTNVSS